MEESKHRCCETSHRPSARRESAVGRPVQAARPESTAAPPEHSVPLGAAHPPSPASRTKLTESRSPRPARRLGARAPLVEESKHRCCETSHRPSARRESAVGRAVQAHLTRDPSRRRLLRSSRSPLGAAHPPSPASRTKLTDSRSPRPAQRLGARAPSVEDSTQNAVARHRTARQLGARAPWVEDSKHRCRETSPRPMARRESAVGGGVQAPLSRDVAPPVSSARERRW